MLVCETADNAIRWKAGERLDHLFEQRCDAFASAGGPEPAAILTDFASVSFSELDARANRAARYLLAQGLTAGDCIGLLFDKTVETYVALLAVLKINAAYVPLDASFPSERIAFILEDAGVKAMVSLSSYADKLAPFDLPKIFLDAACNEIGAQRPERLSQRERPAPKDELCYVIYTSGTTGNPKGVAIEHASICNFVRVAGEVYGIEEGDRAYQGMTIAFDFSVEELWVPLLKGATLVPGRPGTSLVGDDLADFLIERKVTYLACVPTLLATIEKDLPDLRILLVSGEACPQNLVVRWHRPGRTILNAYGPTEATVTATLTELYPDKPVTIGSPLPTYTIVILDETKDAALERGALGEIGIAGVGLAKGYLNRDDLTARKFIPDFLGLPNNPAKRIYRTGDVGRINEAGEVEFHGRIDTQVKLRGYRVELGEIEAVISQLPQIGQAVVHTWEPEPGTTELVAYYTLKQGETELPLAEVAQTLKARLPGYMIPGYFEKLAAIPMTGSNKADRKSLPAPTGPRFAAGGGSYVAPRSEREQALADALMEVMKVDRVSVADNFFHDMGAHSLLMARFCSSLRRQGLSVAIKDIYLNPTIEKLAQHLGAMAEEELVEEEREPLRIPSNLAYYGCGALQLAFYLGYGSFLVWLLVAGFEWTYARFDDPLLSYARIVGFAFALFILLSIIPIAAKWVLIGRFKKEAIPIWSFRYFRFWVVKSLMGSAPIVLFRGTPLYNLYLRLLGAHIGANTVLRGRFLPVCTDLLSIGANTILRTDCVLLGYKAQANYIYTGTIRIGDDAIVGEASVLDIDTEIGDGAQLGHASSLQSGQRVPAGKCYHGSPAQETSADYRFVEARNCTPLRRALFSALQLASVFLFLAGLPVLFLYFAVPYLLALSAGAQLANPQSGPELAVLALEMLAVSFPLFFGALLLGLPLVRAVPWLFHKLIEKDKTYVLFGFHYWVFRSVAALSNSPVYNQLFGDSALIVPYLRFIGYRLNQVVQTGSNFGMAQKHDDPFLCDIGSGTMASDGLLMINAPMSSSSFALREVHIGERNYLGNLINFPAAAKVGANCLLATKVMVPTDGAVRENVGLLGSPAFEIPRVVDRDAHLKIVDEPTRRRLVAEKTRYNVATIVGYLLCTWLLFAINLFMFAVALLQYRSYGATAFIAFTWASMVVSILFFALMERAGLKFGRLKPQIVSMYDRGFWLHERHWKYSSSPLVALFKGTPLKNAISRLLGVRLGAKVFDDGCFFIDKTLLEVGDFANLNEACIMSGHSLEEGVFKSDRIRVGDGCTIGAGAFVHYGVSMSDDVVLDPDSFLMKGESPDPGTKWRGNPARAVRQAAAASRLVEVTLPAAVAPVLAVRGRP
jgi:non-ribosomal peptide synthetase-like protein